MHDFNPNELLDLKHAFSSMLKEKKLHSFKLHKNIFFYFYKALHGLNLQEKTGKNEKCSRSWFLVVSKQM
jgi:hypothetical protein